MRTHSYGDHAEHEADLRLPAGAGPFPVAVLLHGGFWRAPYTRSLMDGLADDLERRGWASWNVEYRRLGCGGGVPETLEDVEAALDALVALDAPLDRAQVVAIGHSAGGHLALWAAGSGKVAAAISLAGVADLTGAAHEQLGAGAAVELCGGQPGERPEAYARADPMLRLPTRVPTLLVHGDADDRVPLDQSRRYAEAARRAGDRCELVELARVGHFEPIDARAEAWREVVRRLPGLVALPM